MKTYRYRIIRYVRNWPPFPSEFTSEQSGLWWESVRAANSYWEIEWL